jgi:hypothetical protein
MSESPRIGNQKGLRVFAIILGILLFLNVGLAFTPVSDLTVQAILGVLVTIIFIGLPVLGLFRAGDHPWNPKLASTFVGVGVAAQITFTIIAQNRILTGFPGAIAAGLSQTGLVLWCAGLGALLATLLKEKNLIVPVSAFLAAFDIFLVLNPSGFTQKIMQAHPEVLQKVAMSVPKVESTPTFGPVSPAAFVGPADLLFMAMFFVAIFKYQMRARETMIALIPTLAIYMGIVILTGFALPAMVPIGIVVLIVNWKEFTLSKEEWVSTGVLIAFMAALFAGGMWLSKRSAPSTAEDERGPTISVGSPETTSTDPLPSEPPPAPENR